MEEKKHLVDEVFSSVADRYDVMNDLMSLGIHRYWKRQAIEALSLSPNKPLSILDLAGGTGDLSHLMAQKVSADSQIVLADINDKMMQVGRAKRIDQGSNHAIKFTLANAEHLPFADASFDRVIMGFGLRNVTDKQVALNEMFRVLSPSGKVLILEFSQVQNESFAKLYDWYSFNILPMLGKIVVNDGESYQYLAESIRKHPNQSTLLSMIKQAGFSQCHYENYLQGMVAIHTGEKSNESI